MNEKPRVRFAPSPTGYLHVGGARTALFNWLFARHHGGVFVLRIEDTDLVRSSEEMVTAITDGMTWLGMDWDEGPFFQGERVEVHREAARELLERGLAYRCFCDPEELEAERLQARQESADWRYDGRCRRIEPEASRSMAEAGQPFALRFKVPHDQAVEFLDHVHGPMRFDGDQIEDFVILRRDTQPTYQLACVVDDLWMKISHVIRGADHLSNTPKQILLYRALGASLPEFAHLPLILGPDKGRLSKRHGATSVGEYKAKGFHPEAVVNFLALLGWSPGDDREYLRRGELIELFSMERVLKKPSVFDEAKLEWLNGQYMIALPSAELLPGVRAAFEQAGCDLTGWTEERLLRVIDLLKERARLYRDFPEVGSWFFQAPAAYAEESVALRWKDPAETRRRLAAVLKALNGLRDWTEGAIERTVRSVAEREGVGAGKFIHAIRVALTGIHTGPGLFELMTVLDREEVVARMERAIAWLEGR
jgi:glutamyl-tRNA synthetase